MTNDWTPFPAPVAETVACTRCEVGTVFPPATIEVDPVCADCAREIAEELAQRDAAFRGTTTFATVRKGCPSWGVDEDCGGPLMEGSDLCGDCHMARCDAESPRIPH